MILVQVAGNSAGSGTRYTYHTDKTLELPIRVVVPMRDRLKPGYAVASGRTDYQGPTRPIAHVIRTKDVEPITSCCCMLSGILHHNCYLGEGEYGDIIHPCSTACVLGWCPGAEDGIFPEGRLLNSGEYPFEEVSA